MPYYGRIDVSKAIDISKTSESKECDICHCWHYLDKRFEFQTCVCNVVNYVLIMSIILNDIVVLNINGPDCSCIITGISKSEDINLMQNIDLSEKSGTL